VLSGCGWSCWTTPLALSSNVLLGSGGLTPVLVGGNGSADER
jgi:hypothetical protein